MDLERLRSTAPSGLASMEWLITAIHGDASTQERLLAYNEDDVRATLAIREWLSATPLPVLPEEETTGQSETEFGASHHHS